MTDRFKGLDVIDRIPEGLWTEVQDTVQEAVIKTIPKKKQCKKAKWLSEEGLQIAEKRRDAKTKGAKARYTHLNAEFQRTARRDKKAILSDQRKETEETIQWERLEISSRKLDTKGTFHAKMGTIKERNSMDQTEVLRRGAKNTQKNCMKKVFMTQITTVVCSLT